QKSRHSGLIAESRSVPQTNTLHLTLAQALIKQDGFGRIVERGTEAGIHHFMPLVTERCIVREMKANKQERWAAIAREAAEQSRRMMVPRIDLSPTALSDLTLHDGQAGVVFHPQGAALEASSAWQTADHIMMVVGPEGGLSDQEVENLVHRGFQAISLGPHIYRAEYAGSYAAVMLQALRRYQERNGV
ncbi:MAG: RsmE family RNA methyltransferase, partial [Firmicutes bacterium]|nr:RsmE family RNA methyltransferase [Bacillota bacterium]